MRTTERHAGHIVAVLATILALLAVAGPVAAASPQQVTIVSNVTFNPESPNSGTFTTSGAATTSGVICPAGTFVDTGIRFAGFQSDRGMVQLQVTKQFTCTDGSGTFGVKMQIQANVDTGLETFSWVVTGGSGRYQSLHGSGLGSTVPNPPTGNINTYQGFVLR